jgi:hypothetical protein
VHLPGAQFLIAGLLLGVAWSIAWRYARPVPPTA